MTVAEKLAEVTAQIRKEVPRTMELKEGCLLYNKSNKDRFKIIDIDANFDEYTCLKNKKYITSISFKDINLYTIIGHEIMLNDVLEWLSKIDKPYRACFIDELGFISRLNFDMTMEVNGVKWNLQSSYLNIDQSEEMINFLYNLKKD